MRLLLYLLIAGLALPGQPTEDNEPFPGLREWAAIQDYLALSNAQIRSILDASGSSRSASVELWDRQREVNAEILEETRRSPLRPPELGRLQAELETIRRRLVALDKERNVASRAALNESQLAKLRTLDEFAARRDVMLNATTNGLSPVDCRGPSLGYVHPICQGLFIPGMTAVPQFGMRPDDSDPSGKTYFPRLSQFLGLTEAQLKQIEDISARHTSETEISRMAAVLPEIRVETGREVLDSFGFGLRYAEIETLRRKIYENDRTTTQENEAVLTASQRVKLDALKEAVRLYSTVQEARNAKIIGSRCGLSAIPSDESPNPMIALYLLVFIGDCPDRRALEELPQ